jgi:hypothetical protein
MERFIAEITFRFQSESQDVGGQFRRLGEAARNVGFELVRGTARRATPDEWGEGKSGPTYYVPLIDAENQ